MTELDIEKFTEFDDHKLVSFIFDSPVGLKGFIVIHRGGLTNPAFGATRLWNYSHEAEALSDALRLSKMMSYKSAMAGLKYGGAKAVLIDPGIPAKTRKEFFRAYAQKVNYFGGKFVTGTDVGLNEEDIHLMRKETPYVIGTEVDSSYFTALGVVCGIQAALSKIFKTERIKGRSFAIQGVGKTGLNILHLLYKDALRIFISDIDSKKAKLAKKKFPRVKVVSPARIHRQKVSVFAPCALSDALNSKSVSELQCRIVAGSANNQLSGEDIGNLLHKLGILYVPDYIVNAGGLISVVDEFEHDLPSEKRIIKKIGKIKRTLKIIFYKNQKQNRATNIIANEMAEKIFNSHL